MTPSNTCTSDCMSMAIEVKTSRRLGACGRFQYYQVYLTV